MVLMDLVLLETSLRGLQVAAFSRGLPPVGAHPRCQQQLEFLLFSLSIDCKIKVRQVQ